MTQNPCQALRELLASREPVIALITDEEERALEVVEATLQDFQSQFHWWTCTEGLDGEGRHTDPLDRPGNSGLLTAIREMATETKTPGGDPADPGQFRLMTFAVLDLHPFLKNPQVRRALKDLQRALRRTMTSVVLISPEMELPDGLDRIVEVLRLPLPERDELANVVRQVKDVEPEPDVLDALAGLTVEQAKLAVKRSLARHKGKVVVAKLLECKKETIRNTGSLELMTPSLTLADVGGYENLREYLNVRRKAFSREGRMFVGSFPRGILLTGIPGSGKSLIAKALGGEWELPVIRFDVSRVFGSLVGQSETQMRRALELPEKVAPCVFWCDEVDKAFAGMRGQQGDSGVSHRVFGSMLTWLQEHDTEVFTVMTANDVSALPSELLRKGRVDELWFLDLPNPAERAHIFRVHIEKRIAKGCGLAKLEKFDFSELAEAADGFVGAEIETAVVDALYSAFAAGTKAGMEEVLASCRSTVPLRETMREQIDALREWAGSRARFASPETGLGKAARKGTFLDATGTLAGRAIQAGVLDLGEKD